MAIPDCPYIAKWKRQLYMEGYNDRCDGNEKKHHEDRKANKAYNRGWKNAGS